MNTLKLDEEKGTIDCVTSKFLYESFLSKKFQDKLYLSLLRTHELGNEFMFGGYKIVGRDQISLTRLIKGGINTGYYNNR